MNMGTFSSIAEDFEEGAIKYLRIETEFEKDNNEWQNEYLDDFNEDDLD